MKAENFTIQPGAVVFHKSSDEPLCVRGLTVSDDPNDKRVYVSVRRFSPATDGSSHYETQTFWIEELETGHARALREADFMQFLFDLRSKAEKPVQAPN